MAVQLERSGNTLASLVRDLRVLRPDAQPPGNYLAFNLQQVYNDSGSLFPDSVYSGSVARRNRWRSLYDSDFLPQHDLPTFRRAELLRPKDQMDIFDEDTPKMFNNWKIPERITDSCRSERYATPKARAATTKPTRTDGESAAKNNTELPVIRSGAATSRASTSSSGSSSSSSGGGSGVGSLPVRTASHSPSKVRALGRTPMHAASAGARLPSQASDAARLTACSAERPLTRAQTAASEVSTEKVARRAARPPKAFLAQQVLGYRHSAPASPKKSTLTAIEWLHNASSTQRRTIEQALKLMTSRDSEDELYQVVEDWLSKASVTDRNVAVDFFSAFSSAKLSGDNCSEAQKKVDTIARLLKGNASHSGVVNVRPAGPTKGDKRRRRMLRLLTPGTRANKWMDRTWHRLPTYDESGVQNRASFYTQPHKDIGQHFVIHPEWG